MEPKFKIGQIVYEYTPYRRCGCIVPREIMAIYWTQNYIQYILNGSNEKFAEEHLFALKNELIDVLIEEENRDHERRVKDLESFRVQPFEEG